MLSLKLKQRLAIILTVVISVTNSLQVYATGNWKYENDNWYHFTNGIKDIGWISESDDIWYYLDSEGVMETGWFQDVNGNRYYLNSFNDGIEGRMRYGWYQDVKEQWYFFSTEHNGRL